MNVMTTTQPTGTGGTEDKRKFRKTVTGHACVWGGGERIRERCERGAQIRLRGFEKGCESEEDRDNTEKRGGERTHVMCERGGVCANTTDEKSNRILVLSLARRSCKYPVKTSCHKPALALWLGETHVYNCMQTQ